MVKAVTKVMLQMRTMNSIKLPAPKPIHATVLNWHDLDSRDLDSHEKGGAQVTAQGEGRLAQRLTELAEQHQILVLQDFELSWQLSRLPVGSHIPDKVFSALAVVLDFLQQEAERKPDRA
jgi:type III secretion system FlhB-like substrate exporter